jgi:hypothetical protein
MKTQHFKGKPVSDGSSRVCVLFDPHDGRIVHVHGITTLDGAKQIGADELAARVIAHAKGFGHEVAGLKTLHVPIAAMRQPGSLKVSADGREVVQSAGAVKWSDIRSKRRQRGSTDRGADKSG